MFKEEWGILPYLAIISKPIYEAGLRAFNNMASRGQVLFNCVFNDHLDVLHTAVELGPVVAGEDGSGDLELLRTTMLSIPNPLA